ncbi:beta-ureidopropionase isoform X1 [Brachyhypopomus gauderio]|uniref:beta-ureidopropionase isoform X1 n=1 Tax=Brachyhypopomus gauderio TaxID=698409 RepID=UPI0040420F25
MKFCKQAAETQKKTFNPSVPLVVHWDGKMLPDVTGHEQVDRLPVLVSGFQVEKLLGVPKLPNGTGETVSNAVVTMVQEWGIESQVKAMCFDTTASNTGRKNGACGVIETRLVKNLLHLACHHHIHEIVVGDVFKHCFGPSSGPEIGLFKRFHDYWPRIDRSQFQTAMDDPFCVEALAKLVDLKVNAISFAKDVLSSSQQTRDDYRELLELTVLFLGDTPPRGIRIMAPGTMHRARWMAKLLYCMKIWLFKEQFKLTAREETSLRDMSLFGCLLYTKAWTLCPKPASAPANDLAFLKLIHQYANVNKGISTAAVKAFLRHLWYLSEELIILAFFDDGVNSNIKRNMITALQKAGSDETKPPKRIEIEPGVIPEKELQDFVTNRTISFFHTLGLNADFLTQADPDTWQKCDDFPQAKKYVDSLAVVNDRAERAVKLMQDFNTSITTNEDQKQYLLQAVLSHRARYPVARKSLFVEPGSVADDIQH